MGEINPHGPTPSGWSVEALSALNVPVVQAICASTMRWQWEAYRDAIPEGGEIIIRLSHALSAGRPIARVEVEDSGEGMTPEVLAKLFSPFFTTKGHGRGTGLGLASVRQLMHDLGGSLSVASQPGLGTTFVLRIPASPEPPLGRPDGPDS